MILDPEKIIDEYINEIEKDINETNIKIEGYARMAIRYLFAEQAFANANLTQAKNFQEERIQLEILINQLSAKKAAAEDSVKALQTFKLKINTTENLKWINDYIDKIQKLQVNSSN